VSHERQRAREARQAARRAEVETAAARREKTARRAAVRSRLAPTVRRRRRRFGALSTWARVRLVLLFFAIQALAWPFVTSHGARFSLAVLTIASELVYVRTRRSPAR
jgi:hypothetical protein